MSWRRLTLAACAVVLLCPTVGCDEISDRASAEARNALQPTTSTSAAPSTTAPAPACDPRASFRPSESLAPPNEMREGSFMRTIQERGHLNVGIDENTLYFSSRDPSTSSGFVGFEVDLAHELAAAIFGDPTKVRFTTVVTSQKVDFVESGLVDLAISVVSATCARWQQVAFTTTYYEASQQILVPGQSDIAGAADLPGRIVCVTKGSSSEQYLADNVEGATVLAVVARTDCLVALQEGRADAILLPSSILAGLRAQDPTTRVLPERLQPQYYAIPIARDHVEFVRFVNALLERWRADGRLLELQQKNFADAPELQTLPVAPEPRYLD